MIKCAVLFCHFSERIKTSVSLAFQQSIQETTIRKEVNLVYVQNHILRRQNHYIRNL